MDGQLQKGARFHFAMDRSLSAPLPMASSPLRPSLPLIPFPHPKPRSTLLSAHPYRSQTLISSRRRHAIAIVRVLPAGGGGGRRRGRASVVSSAAHPPDDDAGGGGGAPRWASWVPQGVEPDRILRLISGATSSPICQFIDSPRTFLHSVDPRIKLVWLLALVVLPARSHIYVRLGLVSYLSMLSVSILPTQIWMDQLGRVALLSGILFIMLGFGSDGVPPLVQSRTPPPSMLGLPSLPPSLGGYSYVIMKLGPLQLTRKGLSVACTSACLSFTIFQSASLCLTTTTPEQLASAIWWFMSPLTVIGVPVAEIILTLLLSLRFINLVFDEVRNTALGIVARRINWKQLTVMETLDVFVMYVRRIFKNLFSHAEQISKVYKLILFDADRSENLLWYHDGIDSLLGLRANVSE